MWQIMKSTTKFYYARYFFPFELVLAPAVVCWSATLFGTGTFWFEIDGLTLPPLTVDGFGNKGTIMWYWSMVSFCQKSSACQGLPLIMVMLNRSSAVPEASESILSQLLLSFEPQMILLIVCIDPRTWWRPF